MEIQKPKQSNELWLFCKNNNQQQLSNGDQWISYCNISKFSGTGTVVTVKFFEDKSRAKEIWEDPLYNNSNNNASKNGKILVVDDDRLK